MSGRPPFSEPSVARRLGALEAAFRRALRCGGEPSQRALADLTRRAAELTRAAGSAPPDQAPACLAALRRIRRLHDQLALRVALERQEAADGLAHLRTGKKTLKAYRDAP